MNYLLKLFGVDIFVKILKLAFAMLLFFGTIAAMGLAVDYIQDLFLEATTITVFGVDFELIAMMGYVGTIDAIRMMLGALVASSTINLLNRLTSNIPD